MKIHIVLFWIDITFPSAGETASSSSPGGVLCGSRKNMMKKMLRIAPMIKKRNRIEDIRIESDKDLKPNHAKIVRNAIPIIHDNEPLASMLENPSHEIN
jgi:hypothetical protein